MKRGKKVEGNGIQMPCEIAIGNLGDGAINYFGVLESDKVKMKEINLKVRQDYYRRVRKILKSRLNGGNTVKAINTWAVAPVRYTGDIVD